MIAVADIATDFTLEFVRLHLPPGSVRILEVGCGDGAVAARLERSTAAVVAIDADEDSVRAARKRGVDARRADWPEFEDGVFDAVLFVRSLHHISPLNAAVRRAAEHLSPGGRVIVEDFAFDTCDRRTAQWFQDRLRRIPDESFKSADGHSFAQRARSAADPLAAWREDHARHGKLHTAAELRSALDGCFDRVEEWTAPYLFRYVAAALAPGEAQTAALNTFLKDERGTIENRAIRPIGRRYVASLE
ncbi:MAG: class I SAM-dependent methyltransferase [Planctomycetota bacterium]|nr:class I SAM-dependent methyltransferase [Planctomycetota bacterium]